MESTENCSLYAIISMILSAISNNDLTSGTTSVEPI